MKKRLFNSLILVCALVTLSAKAQKPDKKYTERFKVSPNVTINVNTRYTDIEIETWNKNEVVIEAYMEIEGEVDQLSIDNYFKKWNFKALGNKNEVTITSKTANFIDINSFDFDAPDYDFFIPDNLQLIMPDISVYNLSPLDSMNSNFPEVVMPPMPPIPPLEPLIIDLENAPYNIFMMEKFDFKKHKKDKNYLKEWKERNKEALKGYDVKIGRNSISISTKKDAVSKEALEKRQRELEAKIEERQKHFQEQLKERQKELEKRQEELEKRFKEKAEERKVALMKRKEALKERKEVLNKRRAEIRAILQKREKVKIRRIVKIKAPKNAKFNMNVTYGSMRFPN